MGIAGLDHSDSGEFSTSMMLDNSAEETFFRPGVRMGLIVRVTNFLRRWMPENFRWRFAFAMGVRLDLR